MLTIRNLHASVEDTEIIRGLDLEVGAGEVHAIMGPNGAGKSTLARVLAGHEDYRVTEGEIRFLGRDLLAMNVEARAREGIFLSFQQPVEIPGVNTAQFMLAAVNAIRAHRGLEPLDGRGFFALAREKLALVGMDPSFLKRNLNEGFSGGEKKRNEIFQMAMLEPRLAVLDETDSGLDVDALRVIARGVESLRAPERSMLVITHHQKLLDHLVPDRVHVLRDGRIVASGGPELARRIDAEGYGWIEEA